MESLLCQCRYGRIKICGKFEIFFSRSNNIDLQLTQYRFIYTTRWKLWSRVFGRNYLTMVYTCIRTFCPNSTVSEQKENEREWAPIFSNPYYIPFTTDNTVCRSNTISQIRNQHFTCSELFGLCLKKTYFYPRTMFKIVNLHAIY